jgi:PII-like signaling protein
VSEAALKLTTYFNERAAAGERFLADAIFDLYERHALHTSVLLRGAYGFGARHGVHGDRSLTLSESLPAVSAAVDTPGRIMGALEDVLGTARHGLVTLERAQLVTAEDPWSLAPGADAKLTVYGGRGIRAGGAAGYVAAIDLLRARGASAAIVLLGVDGTLHGERRRGRFFARNADVPLMLIAIGSEDVLGAAAGPVAELIDEPVMTLERVQTLRTAGDAFGAPPPVPDRDDSGLPIWQKVSVHVEEPAHVHGQPVYLELVHRLHAAGAAGITVLRAVRGFYGDHEPFADRALALRRRVPVLVVAIDRPANVSRWWSIVEELTARDGLVTSELVPAIHAPMNGRPPSVPPLAKTATSEDQPFGRP